MAGAMILLERLRTENVQQAIRSECYAKHSLEPNGHKGALGLANIYIYIYMCMYIYMYIYSHVYVYAQIHIYTCI